MWTEMSSCLSKVDTLIFLFRISSKVIMLPWNCCFTKLWRFGDSDFPAFGGTSIVKNNHSEKLRAM
jgi:hypothetical protein